MQQNYVVFGGSGGIGSELVRRLRAKDARVMAVARDAERLRALASETGCETLIADVTDLTAVTSVFDQAIGRWDHLDGVAHCVGSLLLKPVHLTTDAEWIETISVNLTSAFYVLREATKRMSSRGGSIVFCSSVAAQLGLSNHEAIAAAKGGIEGLVRSAAATYAARGLRINAVAPGLTETGLTARLRDNAASAKASRLMHPLGRFGTPTDIASGLEWLLGAESGWCTGQILHIDGGMSTVRPRSA